MIGIHCSQCGRLLRANEEHIGKAGRCPGCGAVVRIAAATEKRAPAPDSLILNAADIRDVVAGSDRRELHGLGPAEFVHDLDRAGRDALERQPGLGFVVERMRERVFESASRLMHAGSNIRVTRRGFPRLAALFEEACGVLDLPLVPPLYVEQDKSLHARVVGVEAPLIAMGSESIDLLSTTETLFLLGRELGRLKCGHNRYTELFEALPHLGCVAEQVTTDGGAELMDALRRWRAMSELTADRAGLLVCQDQAAALRAMMKMAGLPVSHYQDMDVAAFVAQAKELGDIDQDSAPWLGTLTPATGGEHPWMVMRAAELLRWVENGDYAGVLERPAGHADVSRPEPAAPHWDADPLDRARQALEGRRHRGVFLQPDIPGRKLARATRSYASSVDPADVVLLYDNTLFGGGGLGLCATTDALVWTDAEERPHRRALSEVASVRVAPARSILENDHLLIDGQRVPVCRPETADVLAELVRVFCGHPADSPLRPAIRR
jgi:hypothetical protein